MGSNGRAPGGLIKKQMGEIGERGGESANGGAVIIPAQSGIRCWHCDNYGQPVLLLEGEQHWGHGRQTGGRGHSSMPSREPHPRVLEAICFREMLGQVLTNEGGELTWDTWWPSEITQETWRWTFLSPVVMKVGIREAERLNINTMVISFLPAFCWGQGTFRTHAYLF